MPVVDEHPETDYRKVPPSWHVYTYPRSDVTRFEPSKVDDYGLLGMISLPSIVPRTEDMAR